MSWSVAKSWDVRMKEKEEVKKKLEEAGIQKLQMPVIVIDENGEIAEIRTVEKYVVRVEMPDGSTDTYVLDDMDAVVDTVVSEMSWARTVPIEDEDDVVDDYGEEEEDEWDEEYE